MDGFPSDGFVTTTILARSMPFGAPSTPSFPDRVTNESNRPFRSFVAKARRHEFHANAPYYWEEELATDIDAGDRALLIEEAALAASFLSRRTRRHKINVGALGNVVRQFHLHVVARRRDP
jgi:hypothetical protein